MGALEAEARGRGAKFLYVEVGDEQPLALTRVQKAGWLWRPSKCKLRLPPSSPRQWNGGYKPQDEDERRRHPCNYVTMPKTPQFVSEDRLARRSVNPGFRLGSHRESGLQRRWPLPGKTRGRPPKVHDQRAQISCSR